MTDPLPGVEPVPLTPPAQPIEGDSHRHLIAPLQRARPRARLPRRDPRAARRRPGGWCDPKRKQIVVAAGPANRQVRTLVHELAHALGLGYEPVRPRARPRCSSTASPTSSAPPPASTSAASRSPTSPAGAKTARWTPSASTPRRSTRSPGASRTRSSDAHRRDAESPAGGLTRPTPAPLVRGCSPPRVSDEPAGRPRRNAPHVAGRRPASPVDGAQAAPDRTEPTVTTPQPARRRAATRTTSTAAITATFSAPSPASSTPRAN